MQPESSPNRNDDVAVRVGLLRALESGLLEQIECPYCHNRSVSVRFTHPAETEYRTWFICEECSFKMRTQNSERPRYFSPDRIDIALEAYDLKILGKRRLETES